MQTTGKQGFIRAGILALVIAAGSVTGCDDDNFDHDIPEGQGSLVVNNFTGDRLRVFIDGMAVNSVTEGKYQAYDRVPGIYRVALDSDDSERSWADDVDVLEGTLTVVEVSGYDYREFTVRIYFD